MWNQVRRAVNRNGPKECKNNWTKAYHPKCYSDHHQKKKNASANNPAKNPKNAQKQGD